MGDRARRPEPGESRDFGGSRSIGPDDTFVQRAYEVFFVLLTMAGHR